MSSMEIIAFLLHIQKPSLSSNHRTMRPLVRRSKSCPWECAGKSKQNTVQSKKSDQNAG